MFRAIGRLLAWIGGLVVVMALLAGAGAIYRAKQKKPVPAKTVLEVNLNTLLTLKTRVILISNCGSRKEDFDLLFLQMY